MNNEIHHERLNKLKEKVSEKYATDSDLNAPSVKNSDITIVNGTEIIVLRDKNSRVLAHYQVLNDHEFLRMDKK